MTYNVCCIAELTRLCTFRKEQLIVHRTLRNFTYIIEMSDLLLKSINSTWISYKQITY